MKHLLRIHVLLKPYFWQTVLNLLILLSMTGLSLVVPRVIRAVIDDGLLKGQAAFLFHAALILLGLGLLAALLSLFQRYLSQWVASHIGYDLRNKLYDHMQYMPFTFHDHSQTADITVWVLAASGVIGLASWYRIGSDESTAPVPGWVKVVLTLPTLASAGAVAYTSYTGGHIGHQPWETSIKAPPLVSVDSTIRLNPGGQMVIPPNTSAPPRDSTVPANPTRPN